MSETKSCTEEMGKWLKILFWLLIISTAAGIFITEETVEKVPALQLVSTLFVIAYGGVLLKMSACDPACWRDRRRASSCRRYCPWRGWRLCWQQAWGSLW